MNFQEKKKFRFFKIIPWIILGILGAAALALLFGLILMLLWNWIMPEIFGLPKVTYWQAWGLVLLAHILFKGPMGHHDSHHREDDPGVDAENGVEGDPGSTGFRDPREDHDEPHT